MGILTIGIYGNENQQAKLRYMVNTIQEQLNMVNRADVDAFFWVDKKQSSDEEKRNFIKQSCEGKFIVFVYPDFVIPPNFIREALVDIEHGCYSDIELLTKGIHKKSSVN
jgi:hypothetical protein